MRFSCGRIYEGEPRNKKDSLNIALTSKYFNSKTKDLSQKLAFCIHSVYLRLNSFDKRIENWIYTIRYYVCKSVVKLDRISLNSVNTGYHQPSYGLKATFNCLHYKLDAVNNFASDLMHEPNCILSWTNSLLNNLTPKSRCDIRLGCHWTSFTFIVHTGQDWRILEVPSISHKQSQYESRVRRVPS